MRARIVALPLPLSGGTLCLAAPTSSGQSPLWSARSPIRVSDDIAAAAASLHPCHRLPFVLSRCAASVAIAEVTGSGPITFSGSRASALRDFGVKLSLSHEEALAAAVAWRPCTEAEKAGHRGAASDWTYAVDVAGLAQVRRLSRRFPQFRSRWLPQCQAPGTDSLTVEEAGEVWTQVCAPECLNTLPPALLAGGEGGAGGNDLMVDLASVAALAQHWSLRECCVKLLGINGRSFTYGCFGETEKATFPRGCFRAGAVYAAELGEEEAAAFASQSLSPLVHWTSWVDWTWNEQLIPLPHAVTVAACEHRRR